MNEDIKKIADHYGLDAQLNIAVEELAELIQAIAKFRRINKRDQLNVIAKRGTISEEIADVKVMLAQIEYLLEIEGIVKKVQEYKIERQLKRMKEGE